jgi:hypothetical protein
MGVAGVEVGQLLWRGNELFHQKFVLEILFTWQPWLSSSLAFGFWLVMLWLWTLDRTKKLNQKFLVSE